MNFAYIVVILVGVANSAIDPCSENSVMRKCDLSTEVFKYLHDSIDKFLPPPHLRDRKTVANVLNLAGATLPAITKKGVLDCIDKFFIPGEEPLCCHVTYVPIYSDAHICNNSFSVLYHTIVYSYGNCLHRTYYVFWQVAKNIENGLLENDIDSEVLCCELQLFNKQKKSNRTKEDYGRAFKDFIQPVIAIYAELNILTKSEVTFCVLSLLNNAASFFGVPPKSLDNYEPVRIPVGAL